MGSRDIESGDGQTRAAIIDKHLREGRVVPAKIREAEALGDRLSVEELDQTLSTWPVMIHPEPSTSVADDGVPEPRILIWSHDSARTILDGEKLTGELRQMVEKLARKARRKQRIVDAEMHLSGEDERDILANRMRADLFRVAAQRFPKRFREMREGIAHTWKHILQTLGDQSVLATGGRLRSWDHLANRPFVALDYATRFGPGTPFEIPPEEIARKQAVVNERAKG